MGVYQKCLKNKELAANVLLSLIEFEFSLVSDDTPTLLQSHVNKEQLIAVFRICKSHKWTKFKKLKLKGENFYFRLTIDGLKEIYEIAGPFVSKKRNMWTKLITERAGKKGGYMKEMPSTEKRIIDLLQTNHDWWTVEGVCLNLRLTPSTIRKSFRKIDNSFIERKKIGRSVLWKLK